MKINTMIIFVLQDRFKYKNFYGIVVNDLRPVTWEMKDGVETGFLVPDYSKLTEENTFS